MSAQLKGRKLQFYSQNGVEQSESVEPQKALDTLALKLSSFHPRKGKIQARNIRNWAQPFR
jgi:hypothetical protein